MLNAQGRAICDMMIYRTPSTSDECKFFPPGQATQYDELLIECDSNLITGLADSLYGYRVRRKIEISIKEDLHLWSLFLKEDSVVSGGCDLSSDVFGKVTEVVSDNMTVVSDPRLTSLGLRIVTKEDDADRVMKSLGSIIDSQITKASLNDYILHRYRLGVGEGVHDHPESNCFPLECNADYLGSVSFNKGCYLGQELTSRIHHTGVIRKRLMPVTIEPNLSTLPILSGARVVDPDKKRKIGQLRHLVNSRGLALLRTDLLDQVPKLIDEVTSTRIIAYSPYWWSQS